MKEKQIFFLEFPCFIYEPVNVGNMFSSSSFSKSSLYIWKFSVHVLLMLSLKDFDITLLACEKAEGGVTFKKFSRASLVAEMVRNFPAMQETGVWFLCRDDSLEKEMATHSTFLAWRIPWTEEPGGLQSTESQSQTLLSD